MSPAVVSHSRSAIVRLNTCCAGPPNVLNERFIAIMNINGGSATAQYQVYNMIQQGLVGTGIGDNGNYTGI